MLTLTKFAEILISYEFEWSSNVGDKNLISFSSFDLKWEAFFKECPFWSDLDISETWFQESKSL